METPNNFEFNPYDVKYLLSLRYNPSSETSLNRISPDNFSPQNQHASINEIEKMIVNDLEINFKNLKENTISLSLSGGVDSTLVFGIIKKFFPEINIETISVKFSNSIDETPNAKKIAEEHDSIHHVLHIENYLEELPKAISIIKQPFWDLHWYYVVKKAKNISNTLLSGDGGDELFGGYTFRYQKFLSKIDSNSTPDIKTAAYIECHERDHVPDQNDLFGSKIKFTWKDIHELLIPYFKNNLTPIEQVFLADFNGKLLYNFSPVNSTMSESFQVQSFSPLLSDNLINYAMKISPEQKYNVEKNIGKLLLRRLLKNYQLDTFVEPRKLGFSIDTVNYWKSHGFKLCKDFLSESNIVSEGWVNQEWISKHLNREQNDVRYVNKFFGLLSFEIWYRLFITKEITANTKLT